MQPGPVISARVAVAPTGMLRRQGLPLRLGPSSLAAMPPLPGSPVGFSALTARLDSCRILVKDSSVMFVPFMAYAASVCAIHSYLCVSASVTDVVCFLNMRKSPSASEKADGDCGHAVMDQVKMALCDSPRPIGESLVGRWKHAEVVFIIIPGAGPIVQICLLHAIPVTGALSVLEQCIGHAVSPCLSRNIGAMNWSEATGLKLERGLG